MEDLILLLVQFIFEILIQLAPEILFEFFFHSIAETTKDSRVKNPLLASFGYFFIGIIIGILSLFIVPSSFLHSESLRLVNLFLAPILSGFVMVAIGKWRLRRGQELLRINLFIYGFLFAFGMALIRFLWLKNSYQL